MLGVNPFSAASHARFAARLGLPFSLLVDRGGSVAERYRSGWKLIVRRTVYVLDPQGVIRFARRGFPDLRDLTPLFR